MEEEEEADLRSRSYASFGGGGNDRVIIYRIEQTASFLVSGKPQAPTPLRFFYFFFLQAPFLRQDVAIC